MKVIQCMNTQVSVARVSRADAADNTPTVDDLTVDMVGAVDASLVDLRLKWMVQWSYSCQELQTLLW